MALFVILIIIAVLVIAVIFIYNEPLPGLKPRVSGLWHTCHRFTTVPDYAGMTSASLREAIHPQA